MSCKANRKSQKCSPLQKMAENLPSVSSYLKVYSQVYLSTSSTPLHCSNNYNKMLIFDVLYLSVMSQNLALS